ncbi:MAG: dual specificity protein phosphatase family protein [bacterium]
MFKSLFKNLFHNDDAGFFRQVPLNIHGKLYTSPMPFGAYDRGSRLFAIYKKNKIEHVFVLVTDTELKKKARRNLLDYYAKKGISYTRYTIKDLQAPSIDVITPLVQEAVERLKTQRVAIHCHAGVGRTATSVCCIVIAVEHFTADQAIDYVCQNMSVHITPEQINVIRKFESMFI